jgi:hypothetical protein
MKVFLSNARKDDGLARDLRQHLEREGFSVWTLEDDITPGENWAKKVARALDASELMVLLITPRAFDSDVLRQNVEFVIGSEKYADRVFSVFVGPTAEAGKDVPWILLNLPHRQVRSSKDFGEVVKDILQMSHANA